MTISYPKAFYLRAVRFQIDHLLDLEYPELAQAVLDQNLEGLTTSQLKCINQLIADFKIHLLNSHNLSS